jgi:hypothetical protein
MKPENLYDDGHTGYLKKKSSRRMMYPWQRRFFVIEGHYLKYFTDSDRTDQRGRVDLRSVKLVAHTEGSRSFQMHVGGSSRSGGATRELELRVGKTDSNGTVEDAADVAHTWVDALREVVNAGSNRRSMARRRTRAGSVTGRSLQGAAAEAVAGSSGGGGHSWLRRAVSSASVTVTEAPGMAMMAAAHASNAAQRGISDLGGLLGPGGEDEEETELEKLQRLLLCLLHALVERRGANSAPTGVRSAPDPIFDRIMAVVHVESLQELLAPPPPPDMDQYDADKQITVLEEYQKEIAKPLTPLQVRSLLLVQSLKTYDPSLQRLVGAEDEQADSYTSKKLDDEVQCIEVVWKEAEAYGDAAACSQEAGRGSDHAGSTSAVRAPSAAAAQASNAGSVGSAGNTAGAGAGAPQGGAGSVSARPRHQLERRYFHIPQICHLLAMETRDELMQSITRESYEKKMQAFAVAAKTILADIQHLQWLKNKKLDAVLNRKVQNRITWLTFFVNLAINLGYAYNIHWMLGPSASDPCINATDQSACVVTVPDPENRLYITVVPAPYDKDALQSVDKALVQAVFNWLQCVLAGFSLVLYLSVRSPVAYRVAANAARQLLSRSHMAMAGDLVWACLCACVPRRVVAWAEAHSPQRDQWAGLRAVLSDYGSVYYILYLVAAVYAIRFPIVNSFLLFDIVVKSPMARAVLLAVYIPRCVRAPCRAGVELEQAAP